jgi:hypothetical protein
MHQIDFHYVRFSGTGDQIFVLVAATGCSMERRSRATPFGQHP